MGRKKKEIVEEFAENIKPLEEDALNLPVSDDETVPVDSFSADSVVSDLIVTENPSEILEVNPVMKKIHCSASAVNVRACAEGEILFTIKNLSKILVEDEKDGWVKITGYVKADLVSEL